LDEIDLIKHKGAIVRSGGGDLTKHSLSKGTAAKKGKEIKPEVKLEEL